MTEAYAKELFLGSKSQKLWKELDSEEENKIEVIGLTSNREEGRNPCFIRQVEAFIKMHCINRERS